MDIGVHQDGLVHISEICDRFIKHPLEAVSVGDIVDVQVLSVDEKKQRIQLTMKLGTGEPGAKKKEEKAPQKKADSEQKNENRKNNNRNAGDRKVNNKKQNNRNNGNKNQNFKKGNNFFDGIVIK